MTINNIWASNITQPFGLFANEQGRFDRKEK